MCLQVAECHPQHLLLNPQLSCHGDLQEVLNQTHLDAHLLTLNLGKVGHPALRLPLLHLVNQFVEPSTLSCVGAYYCFISTSRSLVEVKSYLQEKTPPPKGCTSSMQAPGQRSCRPWKQRQA